MNIFCIEQNYFTHKGEQRKDIATGPTIYVKPPGALLQTGLAFIYPAFANELYCGCELVLGISKKGKNITEKLAGDYYDSISAGINFIALDGRDELNEEELSWGKVKAWDNSSVTGLYLPAANFKNKNDINFCLYKNRELLQLGNSGLMINNFDTIVSGISKSFFLNIGDLIFTGTPSGIGRLTVGDKLEAFIEDDSLLEFDIE